MSELQNQIKQCRKPTSNSGKETVDKMNEYHFALTSWGLEKVQIARGNFILDIGCGGGRTVSRLAELATDGKVYGIDHSSDCVKWSKEYNKGLLNKGRVEIIHTGVENMPFKDNLFDLVVAVETIYFWPDIADCFKEIKRVLKPGGRFLIVNEMYLSEAFKETNEKCMATGEMTVYSPQQIKLLLKEAGFSGISIDLFEKKNWLRSISKPGSCPPI